MKYSQKKVIQKWKKLFPEIQVGEGTVKVALRGQKFTIDLKSLQKNTIKRQRNTSYR